MNRFFHDQRYLSTDGELAAQKHVQFILSVEKKRDSLEAVAMEHPRMNGEYWCLTILDLLGKLRAVDVDEVLALFNKIDVLDADKVASYVATLQNEDGSFSGDGFSYIAISCLSLLHRLDKISVEKAVNYIVSCKNHDGGFGCTRGGKSHAGQILCCVGALAITGSLHCIDKDLLGWWLCQQQVNSGDILNKAKVKPGGLNGRPEKLRDVGSGTHGGFFQVWSSLTEFIGLDIENGGISDRPDDTVDVYHTYFAVAGFSLLQYPGVKAIDPAYALPVDVVNRITLGK